MKERFDKLLEIWGRVSLGQKISLVVAVLGIIGLSVGIMNWTAGGTSMRPLVSGADSKDLSEGARCDCAIQRQNHAKLDFSFAMFC